MVEFFLDILVYFWKKVLFLKPLKPFDGFHWNHLRFQKIFFFFFREILRFLRNFGGFIAKMRAKMTKMRVSRFIAKYLWIPPKNLKKINEIQVTKIKKYAWSYLKSCFGDILDKNTAINIETLMLILRSSTYKWNIQYSYLNLLQDSKVLH